MQNALLRARLVTAAVDGLVHQGADIAFDESPEGELVTLCVPYLQRRRSM